ncbi:amino acid carrier protein (plasmid) [Bacillus toyonensis]|nr:amino acid carrier protein [Bacillus toyonensis]
MPISLVGFFRNTGRNPIKNLRFVLSSYAILERDIMMKKSSINISISILIPILLMICLINVKYRMILTALFGASIFSTTFLCAIGFILAVLSYIENKNIWAKIGIMLNMLVFIIPFIWIFGCNG